MSGCKNTREISISYACDQKTCMRLSTHFSSMVMHAYLQTCPPARRARMPAGRPGDLRRCTCACVYVSVDIHVCMHVGYVHTHSKHSLSGMLLQSLSVCVYIYIYIYKYIRTYTVEPQNPGCAAQPLFAICCEESSGHDWRRRRLRTVLRLRCPIWGLRFPILSALLPRHVVLA